ncbi:amino acid adenylation domain-containing protein [Archangium sp.]|jgi:amino acid adenylation domain-containing protein|uniref:amino acid adenylation domain-containing protein n=1 Tax=Archangium sp. TaxID=1872627 RepID=UPI002EDA3002
MNGSDLPQNLSAAEKRALLQRLLQQKGERQPPRPTPPRPGPREEPHPLSFLQEAMWFLQELEPDSPAYNEIGLVEVIGPLDVPVLERSFTELLRRHELLRSVFPAVGGVPMQVVQPPAALSLPVVDLSPLPEDAREAELHRHTRAEAERPFALSQGPVFRVGLVRMAPMRHVLFVSAHHIVTDGTTYDLLYRELAAIYEAFSEGRPSPLPEPVLQYSDFSRWQRQHFAGEALERQVAYWRQRLAETPPLELPTDRPRPPVRSMRGSTYEDFTLSPQLTTALRRLSQREGVTFFMLMEAAFKALLARYTGQLDVAVGVSFSGRSQDTANVLGLFANTLVLRTDVSGDPTFRELLKRVQQGDLDAFSHHELPFDKVVEAVRPERDPSRTPLFQVLFDVQKPIEPYRAGPTLHRPLHLRSSSAKMDLALGIIEEPETLRLLFVYSEDLFERASLERLAASFAALLEGIVEDPEQRVSALPVLDEATHRRVLKEWNDTAAELPETCLPRLFEAQVARTPHAEALRFEGTTVTYAELDQRANRLAHALRQRGVGPEVLVAVYLERGVEQIVALLSVLKAGGTYLPLDPDLPPERLDYILDDAWPPVMITRGERLDSVGRLPPATVCVDDDAAEIDASPDTSPDVPLDGRNLAYIIYTSGSTGTPKGSMLEHRAACNMALTAVRTRNAGPGRRVLQGIALGFDASVEEILSALVGGATLVLAPKERLLPGPELVRLAREQGVQTLVFPPPVLSALEPSDFSQVDWVMVGGEACSTELMERWAPGRTFVNAYGPTETTVTATTTFCAPGSGRPPLGRPHPNVRLYVLDEQLQPVPVGVPGELFIGGIGVGRGYLRRPELTAERFVPDPFSGEPGARLYRTGDVVRYRVDGQLEFHGRRDHQVKLRGHRIELGEIESALGRLPDVREAVVLVREDNPGLRQLVAYVVPAPGATPQAAGLRESLHRWLPEYMLPAAYVLLESLPTTTNGKVDRKALPPPGQGASGSEANAGDEPVTPTERALATLWGELLHVERVGRQAHFFDLGGHSLLAAQMASRLRDLFHVEVPVRLLFEKTSLVELAAYLDGLLAQDSGTAAPQRPPLAPVEHGAFPPLSYAQEALLARVAQRPDTALFNVVDAYGLEGPLDAALLQRAWDEVLARHLVLRSTFANEGGRWVQRIAWPSAQPVALTDLGSLPSAEQERAVAEHITRAGQRPFDVEQGPLARAELLRRGPDSHVLILSMHQVVSDAATMDVVLGELLSLHKLMRAVRPAALPEPTLQFADYAHWQRQWLSGATLEAELGFWKEQLSGAPAEVRLPTDRPRPATARDVTAFTSRLHLSPASSAALRELSQRHAATPFMALHAALLALLHRHDAQEDLVVGTPVLQRDVPGSESLPGPLIGTVPLRVKASGDPSFTELLAAARAAMLGAFAHTDVSLDGIAESLGQRPSDPLRMALCNVVLSMHTGSEMPAFEGGRVTRLGGKSGAAKYDLSLRGFDDAEGVSVELEYDPDLFDASTAQRLLGELGAVLESAIREPERRRSELLPRSPV